MKIKDTLIVAYAENGIAPSLQHTNLEKLEKAIGGKLQGVGLGSEAAVLYNAEIQESLILDVNNLVGNLALVALSENGTVGSLTSVKLLKKYAKIFDKPRAKTNPNQTNFNEILEEKT